MTIRPLTPRYAVAPQVTPEDIPAIAAAGFTTLICNRPDSEVPPDLQSAAIGDAARAAGLTYEVLELSHQTLTPENAAKQRRMIEQADGNVLAYCRSGTRCSVIWAMGQIGDTGLDEILAATAAAGYDLTSYLPLLEQAARDRG